MTGAIPEKTADALVDEALELAKGLGRPLRYAQLNSFFNGSTGSIMRKLHGDLSERGVDSYVFWGRSHETVDDHARRCATDLGIYAHGARVRFTGRMGFYSKRDTARLLKELDAIDPDVVHLHNLHGYYVNIEMLFGWLAEHCCQVRWTLHDCWAFTGHCAYFTYAKCAQWKSHCAYDEPCCQTATYPKTYSKRSVKDNFERKRRAFTSIPTNRMTLITPSHWLKGLVKESFFSGYPVEVRHNTVDTSVFKPTPSDFRERFGIGDRFMVLGVASPWTERKGLDDFVRLAGVLDSAYYSIVLVGLSDKQINGLPKGIIGIGRTSFREELAGIYTTADVLFNPTREDNYPTTLLEAEACETPAITYDVGGCGEAISLDGSHIASDLDEAKTLIKILSMGRSAE